MSSEPTENKPKAPDRHVLIIEDDSVSSAIVAKLVEKLGIAPDQVDSAEAALTRLKERNYFLIICDINLPGLSGLDLTKQIRESEKSSSRHTFIVALTGDINNHARASCLDAGMDGYFAKPLNRMQFADFLKRIIKA